MSRSETRTRQRIIGVRVTPDEYDTIQQAATKHGMTVAAYLRDGALALSVLTETHPPGDA